MADRLANAADLALQPGVPELSTTVAERLIEAATSVVQTVTQQRLVRVVNDVVVLEVLNGCSHDLELPERPVVSVSTVLIGSAAVVDFRLVRTRLWRSNGWRSTMRLFPDEPTLVTVTYTHGYDPDDWRIELARSTTLMLAAGAALGTPGITSESIDDYQVVYDKMSQHMAGADFLCSLLRKRYSHGIGSIKVRA